MHGSCLADAEPRQAQAQTPVLDSAEGGVLDRKAANTHAIPLSIAHSHCSLLKTHHPCADGLPS